VVDDLVSRDPASAWALLCAHPALSWTPPLWRGVDEELTEAVRARHAVRAIERNLLVNVRSSGDGNYVVTLSTGPLEDRLIGDGVDPIAPSGRRDERLDVEATTFEDALCALANRVVELYGPGQGPTRSATRHSTDFDQAGAENAGDDPVGLRRPLHR
jgi:hypothetical protein